MLISVNAEPMNLASEFPYLGCTVAYNNSNWVALYQNLSKAWRRWGMMGKVVTNTGATVQERGMFYEVVGIFIW